MYRHPTPSGNRRPLPQAILLAVSLIFTTLGGAASANPPDRGQGNWAEGRILMKGAPGLSDERLAQILERQGGRSQAKIPGIDVHLVQVPAHAEERIVAALARNPHVQFAELDMLLPPVEFIPNDPRYKDQWHLPKIGAPVAWDSASGHGITIAILDTGVDPDHYDLASKLLPGYNAVDGSSNWSDINGHGTAVAGTAAAIANNGVGVASVAWGSTLLPVRVTNSSDGYAYFSDIARGLTWAADQGARVANISYGATSSSAISSAARYMKGKGGLVVVSAGNTGTDLGYADNPDLISVSATNSSDAITSWSSFGNFIDVAAPGANIVTTRLGNATGGWNGTSFSSPVTAGVVALIMSADPHLSPTEVEDILKSTAVDLGPAGWDNQYGHGRVDAAAAVQLALSTTAPPVDDIAPSVGFALANGSTLTDLVSITVNATDNVGVTAVELFVSGKRLGTDTKSPYQFSWDTTAHANGNVTLEARAHDAAGNVGSAAITVRVDNPEEEVEIVDTEAPVVQILSPNHGATVSGHVTISLAASDNVGVTQLACFVNGGLLSLSTGVDSLNCRWDTTAHANGNVTLEARAQDAAGNVGSAAITVRVSNPEEVEIVDTQAPVVQILSPAYGDTVSGHVTISLAASDNVGVTQLACFVNGELLSRSHDVDSMTCRWNTNKLSDGSYIIGAEAMDAAGNVGSRAILVRIGTDVTDDSSSNKPGKGNGRSK